MQDHSELLSDLRLVEELATRRLKEQLSDKTVSADMSSHFDALAENALTAEYNELPTSIISAIDDLALHSGNVASEEAVRLLLVTTMIRWYEENLQTQSEFSNRLREIRQRETHRLLSEIRDPDSTNRCWQLSNDVLQKDLQCFTGKLVPCGAQVVDLHSSVPRSILLSDGPLRLLPNLTYMAKSGGFSKYFAIHTHSPTLSDFHETGWELCYDRIADLLRENPTVRGMLGGSWFYDPALEGISPRLSYLRKTPLENGARLFKIGTSEASNNNAVETSSTRRKLYETGQYTPTTYTLIWPREALMNWSDKRNVSL